MPFHNAEKEDSKDDETDIEGELTSDMRKDVIGGRSSTTVELSFELCLVYLVFLNAYSLIFVGVGRSDRDGDRVG